MALGLLLAVATVTGLAIRDQVVAQRKELGQGVTFVKRQIRCLRQKRRLPAPFEKSSESRLRSGQHLSAEKWRDGDVQKAVRDGGANRCKGKGIAPD
jgi:hypothetical protein